MMKIGRFPFCALIGALLVSGCATPRKAERFDPPSMVLEMKWVKSPETDKHRSDPQAIFVVLESSDTVRVIIRNSGGDQVGKEHVTILAAGTYRLESTFSQLLRGAYFASIRTRNDTKMHYFSIGK